MVNLLIVQDSFDGEWPFAADYWFEVWSKKEEVKLIRQVDEAKPLGDFLKEYPEVSKLVSLGVPISENCLKLSVKVKEAYIETYRESRENLKKLKQIWREQGSLIIERNSEGMWGQSVSEFALGLTIAGLRRIPQEHIGALNCDPTVWDHSPQIGKGRPGQQGYQYSDTNDFVSGTIAEKRVRIVGAGNIGTRYASFASFLGADVAMWGPTAKEPSFHRSGSRRIHHIEELVKDAEIFVPMLPLTENTRGLINKDLINLIPKKALVVIVTRMQICDWEALYKRVANNELALAADVFDIEPLPAGHVLLGRDNVVHTPHIAGRTRHANERYADDIIERFLPT